MPQPPLVYRTRLLSALLVLVVTGVSYLTVTGDKQKAEPVEPEPEEWVMDESLAAYLQQFERNFREGLKEEEVPGAAVAIVKDGRVVFQKGFGVKEKGSPGEVDRHTIFRLGSVSKGFASVLAGVFEEEGAVSWDAPVSGYLQQFRLHDPGQTGRVRVKHVLSHTSGLPRHAYTNLVEDGLPLSRIIDRLEQVPLIAREGEQLAYQNAAYSVIEKVLEAQTRTDFKTLLHRELFQPLGMNHASASFDSIQGSENTAMPHVYYASSQGYNPVPITKKYYNAVSSGGINASASDMGQWLLLLTGHYPDVISEETLAEIYDPLVTMHNRRYSKYWDEVNETHYAMGWRVLDNHGQTIVYHGGYVNGYRSEIAFAPGSDVGISIMVNTHSSYPLKVIPGFFNHFRTDSAEVNL